MSESQQRDGGIMELVLTALLVGSLQVTSYRSVKSQTDESPWVTSIGERVNNHGIAVSQDLLQDGRLHYGDTVYIEGFGFKVVNDCMNARIKNAVDIWVATKQEEHQVGVKNLKVWVVKCDSKKVQRQKAAKGLPIGDGIGVLTMATWMKTLEPTLMFSQTKTNLTPGTDWPRRTKRTSTLTTAP